VAWIAELEKNEDTKDTGLFSMSAHRRAKGLGCFDKEQQNALRIY
jgi:hypothetical protein